MIFYFNKTKKDIIVTQKDKEIFGNNNNCPFCEKKILNLIELEIIVI